MVQEDVEGISIIIPVYNDREELNRCLDSLSSLEALFPYEVIVVDNGSTQEIEDVVKSYNYIYCLENKKGSYAARNTGVKKANYNYLCFTDADCLFDKHWFEAVLSLMERSESFYYAGNVQVTVSHDPSCTEWFEHCFAFDQEENVKNQVSVTAHLLIHRKYFKEFGGFDESYLSGGDFNFTAQVSKKFKLKFAEDALVYHPARSLKEMIKKDIRLIGGKYVEKLQDRNYLYKTLYPFGYSLLMLKQIPRKIKNNKNKMCLFGVFCLKIFVQFVTLISINFGISEPQRK